MSNSNVLSAASAASAPLNQAPAPTIPEHWFGPAFDPSLAADELLHELFEAQVDLRPQAAAILCNTQRITYAQVEARANQLAWYLRAQGAGPGTFVGMLLPRGADVYVALLAILKSGAAYVPLDPDYPADRVAYILSDCNAAMLITTSVLGEDHAHSGRRLILIDKLDAELSRQPVRRLARDETGAQRTDLCYVIYTSGSTGRPKGVQIEHRSACNLVRAEGRIFNVRPSDRVYQGFSIAFDASVEEVWLAFSSGGALVAGTAEMVHAGPGLAKMLTEAGVTVLSCVPTLLSMIQDDLPMIRLLIVGGEACPEHLVKRWQTPSRRMVNTYGPTEATVIATYGDLQPGHAVTIGKPVPNYRVYLLNDQLEPAPPGEAGEICIGGIGLARGYVGRPDLTAEKFVADPFNDPITHGRLYRTGDLGRYTSDGEIEFLGRIDTQVKIRGFRVELSEIESALMQCPGVQSAAVALRTNSQSVQQLIAYVVPSAKAIIDETQIRQMVATRLPVYMVPSLVEPIQELPTLPSGKVDRKSLPEPSVRQAPARRIDPPRTPLQKKLTAEWEKVFAPLAVGLKDNFFVDLGGHSLLAAAAVSRLRHDPDIRDLSVLDIYNYPTIERLAIELEARQRRPAQSRSHPGSQPGTPSQSKSYRACVWAQSFSLYFILAFYSSQWLAPYLIYTWALDRGCKLAVAITASLGILLAIFPLMLVLAIIAKWVLLGRIQPGTYPLWGWFYLRWWFVNRIMSAVPTDFLVGTPLLNIYYRLMGMRLGHHVFLGTDAVRAFDLVSIGEGSSIGQESVLHGYRVENGSLILGRIDIGRRCVIGARSIVQPNVRMEDDSRLGNLSLLPHGAHVPAAQHWVGSPARPLPRTQDAVPDQYPLPSRGKRILFGVLHVIGAPLIALTVILAIAPGMALLTTLNHPWTFLAAPLAAIMFILGLMLEITVFKWLLLGRVKSGSHSLYSWFYFRKWFVDRLMQESLDLLGPLYATLYLNPWYRLLGAKLGGGAEISTATCTSPDLLDIGEESFIADAVALGPAQVEAGRITIAPTRIGRRAFVGNSAMIPTGSVIGDNTLIGVLSTPPLTSPGASQPDTSWLGSPAIFLPQRLVNKDFGEESTYRPTMGMYLQRLLIEFLRVTLPATFFVLLTSLLISTIVELDRYLNAFQVALVFPPVYLLFGIAAALVAVAAKWLIMGTYKPAERPLWSGFVWRTELVTALHENLACPFLVDMLRGTPFITWFFRLLGARIGRRVYMETPWLTEYDLIDIGDDAMLDADCTLQTHLFEDRVMKMSTVRIGKGCVVGAGAIVLYDTHMHDGAALGDLSLLMKGESLPAHTRWEGTPAQSAGGEMIDESAVREVNLDSTLVPSEITHGATPRQRSMT